MKITELYYPNMEIWVEGCWWCKTPTKCRVIKALDFFKKKEITDPNRYRIFGSPVEGNTHPRTIPLHKITYPDLIDQLKLLTT